MTKQTDCPLHETLVAMASGTLADGDELVVADHVENCERCEEILVAIESATLLVELQPAVSAGEFTEGFIEEARCHDFVNAIISRSGPTLEADNRNPLSRRRIRDYELLERLGHGAMGTVFKARHTRLNKLVAIKLLSEKLSKDFTAAARFQREMQAVGQLNDPHIVQALDAGDDDGVLFLVMELAEGFDVARIASQKQPLDVADACEIVRQTAIGMQHAHAQGLIHRDIKPSNLMLTLDKDGRCCVKILDLGLATFEGHEAERHLTDEGQLMGTLEFMAPEQAEDTHAVDSRADVYSLGATLYRLLTGTVPLAGPEYDTPLKRLRALTSEPVPGLATRRTDLPEELVSLVDQMLSRDPNERPQDMAEVSRLVESFAVGHGLEPLLKRMVVEHQNQNADGSFIDELRDTEPSLGETVELASRRYGAGGEARPVLRTWSWLRGFRWQVTGAFGVVALLLSILWIRTDGGYLRIETSDPSIVIAVELLKDQRHVDTIAIGRDRKQYWYRSGDYEVRLPATAEDRFQIDGGAFTLTRGTDRTVRILRVAEPEGPPEIIAEEVDTSLIVVTSTDDGADTPGSLRRAVSKVASGGTVRFAPQLAGETIVLSGKPLKIVNDVTIDGAQLTKPVTIDGNQRSRILDVLNRSKLTVNDVKIARGRDYASGSGIRVIEASLTMRNCVVEGCSNSNNGGGIFCQNGVLLLENCLVIGNSAGQLGGGLVNYGGQCCLRNCLFTKNSSGSEHGGAILNVNSGKMELIHCTLTGNFNSGVSSDRWATLILDSSIIANNDNVADGKPRDVWIQNQDGDGVVARGVNLIKELGAEVKSGPKPIIGDAMLYPLGDYGGSFPTMPPMPGSKAIDAATSSTETPSTDIRGVKRPVDGNHDGDPLPDIGAVEFVPDRDDRMDATTTIDRREIAGWIFDRGGSISLGSRTISDFDGLGDDELQIQGVELHSVTCDDVTVLVQRAQGLSELRHLYISSSRSEQPLNDAAIEPVGKLHQLTSFSLRGDRVTATGIARLQGLRQLRRLGLARVQLTADGLRLIGESFPHLALLTIEARQFSVDDLAPIAAMPSLKQLDLDATVAPPASLASLNGTFATEITLRGSWQRTADACRVLAAMPRLCVVSFFGVKFNEQQLQELVRSDTMRNINFYSSEVSRDTLEHLRRDHPEIEMKIDGIVILGDGPAEN